MKDENYVMKNLQKKKLVRRHKKKWEIDLKFDVLMVKEIRERLDIFVAVIWDEERECVNFLYI